MKVGIAPALLVAQVRNTAGWLWSDERPAGADIPFRILDQPAAAEAAYRSGDRTEYLRLLLAAHYATVATFCPTDVDARIRHHAWMEMDTPEALEAAASAVDEAAAWDAGAVSARSVVDPAHGRISGHDGEWLAVRAGALGRAGVLGASDLRQRLGAAIADELAREEAIVTAALAAAGAGRANDGAARTALEVSTIVAHNLGDLSRVVADWPREGALAPLREAWVRLGHADAPSARAAFVTAGALNKALLAVENPRWLPLRRPRGLRASRALLLPIGPWLDAWGETVATHPALEANGTPDRAEVLEALLDQHARQPTQEGCLRAIAGLHRATRGGIERYVPDLPARMRKDALRGRVRDALDVTPEHFAARTARRFAACLKS